MTEYTITSNIAVYIDGDNANYKDFLYVYEEIKKHGRVIIGRIYGDWTKTEMKGWKDISITYALESINCFGLSKKNSTDIYLICDLLQDLYKNPHIHTYIIAFIFKIIFNNFSANKYITSIFKHNGSIFSSNTNNFFTFRSNSFSNVSIITIRRNDYISMNMWIFIKIL